MDPRILGPEDGELYAPENSCGDRFLVNSRDWGGHVAVVEHRLPPKVLAAPMHLHTKEDEFSFVLEGTVGARFGDVEVVATAGDFVFKPRGEWHTFWNAGEVPARVLEIITPGGLEELFREMDQLTGELTPEHLDELAARYGTSADMDATMEVLDKHGLHF